MPQRKNCFFCQENIKPNYKDTESLQKFISERKKIIPQEYNGLCAKHQRQLSQAVKRARHLALLPFVTTVH